MKEPDVGRQYVLTRKDGKKVEVAKFIRFADGSGMVERDGRHIRFELDQTTWRKHWSQLMDRGIVESQT